MSEYGGYNDNGFNSRPIQWKKWFAWHPAIVDNKKVWLKYVYRYRYIKSDPIWPNTWAWHYGTLFDVLKEPG